MSRAGAPSRAGSVGQRVGDRAVGGGFFDSGALLEQADEIGRIEIGALQEGVTNLMNVFEQQRTADLMPFIMAAAGEFGQLEQLNVGATLTSQGQDKELFASIFDSVMGGGVSA